MKCFLPCFGSCKRSKHSRSVNAAHTEGCKTYVAEGAVQLTQQKTVAESKVRFEEQSNEKVTSTKELREILEGSREEQEKATKEEEEETTQRGEKENNNRQRLLQEDEWSESLFSLSIESRKRVSAAEKMAEAEVNSPMQHLHEAAKEESKGNGVESPKKEAKDENSNTNEEEYSVKKLDEKKDPEYRYRDCVDEGYEDMNLNGSDVDATFEDDDDDHHNEKRREKGNDLNGTTWVQEESSESLFSLSIDSRRPINAVAEKAENEVDSAHDTDDVVSSVLNPIENVTQTQGMVVKTTTMQKKKKKKNDKENINSDSSVLVQDHDVNVDGGVSLSPEHHSTKLSKHKAMKKMKNDDEEHGIRVDTSLSSWLEVTTPVSMKSNSSVGEQTPRGGRGSPWSNEDRPILGALTVEEIRMYSHSASTFSRRSRSKSPDETPIIGTVGSYWTHTGQIIESNSSKTEKGAKVKSSSATLKTRLETAFEASVGEV